MNSLFCVVSSFGVIVFVWCDVLILCYVFIRCSVFIPCDVFFFCGKLSFIWLKDLSLVRVVVYIHEIFLKTIFMPQFVLQTLDRVMAACWLC